MMGNLKFIYAIFVIITLILLPGRTRAVSLKYKLSMLGYDEREINEIVHRRQSLQALRVCYKKRMLGYSPAQTLSPLPLKKNDRAISRQMPSRPLAGYPGGPLFLRSRLSQVEAKKLLAEAGPYLPMVKDAASRNALVTSLILAVIKVESGFDPGAVSRKGALGLMQLMPETARELEVSDPLDPRQNILGGARYLAHCLKTFGDLRLALAAYNAGPGRVARVKRIPMIEETENYVRSIIYYKKVYDHLLARGISNIPGR